MYFDTLLKTSRRDYSGLSSPGGLVQYGLVTFFSFLRVQIQHEMRAIEELAFVTKLSFVPAHKDKAEGFRATLSCYFCMNIAGQNRKSTHG